MAPWIQEILNGPSEDDLKDHFFRKDAETALSFQSHSRNLEVRIFSLTRRDKEGAEYDLTGSTTLPDKTVCSVEGWYNPETRKGYLTIAPCIRHH